MEGTLNQDRFEQLFTNLGTRVEPETTLFQQEIDVILEVLYHVIINIDPGLARGTFILDGQAKAGKAQCIMWLNLVEGNSRENRHCQRTSDGIVADAIRNVLSWPDNSRYKCTEKNALHFGWLPTGIYRDEELEVLVLNTTHGRFLASFCAGFVPNPSKTSSAVLMAIACALAHMGKEDTSLQHSFDTIKAQATDFDRDIIEVVDALFKHLPTPFMTAWHEWHEPANQAGELTLFFE